MRTAIATPVVLALLGFGPPPAVESGTTPPAAPPATTPAAPPKAPPAADVPTLSTTGDAPTDLPGLHNVVLYADGLYSGAAPDGKAGFETLAELGVRTIISVDGAVPDVEAARARGIRYVHLPIGYNGMDRQRTLEIAKAVRELPGPVYVHCHHGKHRSAGAAGAAAVALGILSPTAAVARMRISGTSPSYPGLFACVTDASVATSEELASASSAFPEVWRTSGLVRSMVEADEAFDGLKAIKRAGWTAPTDHPDLVPAAEAGRLADLMRNLVDDPQVQAKPKAFKEQLAEASLLAAALEAGLVAGDLAPDELARRFDRVSESCTTCHAAYRNPPDAHTP
ncbi:MAG: hypothetical protein KDA22_03035 [Phycisphaerales bacterium]|nr:hypothetical protein [Phycisphaerales bacterium]